MTRGSLRVLATIVVGGLVFGCGADDGEVPWFADVATESGSEGRGPAPPPRRGPESPPQHDPDRDPLEIASGSVGPGGLPLEPWPDPVFHSLYCGDNVRGRVEECDSGRPNDFCTSKCRSRDALAVERSTAEPDESEASAPLLFSKHFGVATFDAVTVPGGRTLGAGPHAIAVGPSAFAVTFVDLEEAEASVRVALYAPDGDRLDVYALGEPSSFSYEADPVVAALPDGTFAVAWAAFDGEEALGVLLQRVDPETGPLGSPIAANSTGLGAQHRPDVAWTENGLVVAWVDHSSAAGRSDLRYRLFTSQLEVATAEETLASTSAIEGGVSLLPFTGSFAAAFRTTQDDGFERVSVLTPEGLFFVADIAPGSTGDRPALAEIDETHLLLVYTEGTDPEGSGVLDTGRLRYAIVDTTGPESLDPSPLEPLVASYASDTIGQSQPSAVRSGDAVYVAWRSGSVLGSMLQEELWLKSIPVEDGLLDLTRSERPLPISNLHRPADQRSPNLAAGWSGEIVAAWVDYGKNLPGSAGPDVVAEVWGVATETCFGYEQQAGPPFSLGMPVTPDGSAAYPYPICTVEQLQYVVDTPALQNKQFVLQADLDVRDLTGALGATSPFTGTFDGADYALANFARALPAQDGVGLFEEVQGDGTENGVTDGVVKNLVVIEPTIEGLTRSGAVAGRVLANAKLENVTVVGGTVTSHGARAGGIAGEVLGRVIESSSTADVVGVDSASMLGGVAGEVTATGSLIQTSAVGAVTGASTDGGGLVGSNLGTISRSWASGSVNGTSRLGGLVGTNRASISNSYARGAVSGSRAGALIGQTESGSNVSKSYATGQVAAGTNVGGLTGFQNASSTYAGTLWNATVNSGLSAVGNLGSAPSGVTSKTTTELQQAATFLAQGWDFVNIWGIDEGDDYPVHIADGFDFCPEVPQQSTPPFAIGFGADGTVGNPYPICTRAQMQHIADTSSLYDDHYRLMGDINLSGMTGSIGTAANPFKGSFDGNGRRLSNYARTASSATVGLFGSVFGGTIKNLTVEGFDVRAPGTVGAVAGLVQPGEGRPGVLEDVHVLSSTVRVTTNNVTTVGGLVGRLTGSITGSTASVTVSTNGQTGISRLGGLERIS